jgi:hypothetical protein
MIRAKTVYIESGSPWKKDSDESFALKFRDELLKGEVLGKLKEAQG